MIATILIVLVILWLAGLITGIGGHLIWLLLVIALVIFIINNFPRRAA